MNTATFHINRFFLGSIGNFSTAKSYEIIKSSQELENHIQEMIAFIRQDTAVTPDGHWETFEENIRHFYYNYDDSFFQQNNLILAIVDQGSSRVSYELLGLESYDGLLTINVARNAPMIQTMDFVTWVLNLELDKSYDVERIQVNLIDEGFF